MELFLNWVSLIKLTMCYNPSVPFLLAETSSHATGRDTAPVKHIAGHAALCPQGSNSLPHMTLGLMSWQAQLLIYKFLVNLVHMENISDFQYSAQLGKEYQNYCTECEANIRGNVYHVSIGKHFIVHLVIHLNCFIHGMTKLCRLCSLTQGYI